MGKFQRIYLLLLFLAPSSIINTQSISDSSYYPMVMGKKWEFSADFSPHSESIVDTVRMSGALYYGVARFGTEAEYWLREDNDRVYCFNKSDSTEFMLFDFTIDIGDTIILPPSEFDCMFGRIITLMSKDDTVTTGAGTFYNYYHFRHDFLCMDSGILDTWLAKGIGKVKFIEIFIYGAVVYKLKNYSIVTSVETKNERKVNNSFGLFQNYPNPFNSITNIGYSIGQSSNVSITLYNMLGEKIRTLENIYRNPGNYKIGFDADGLNSGVYYYQLTTDNFQETKRLIHLK